MATISRALFLRSAGMLAIYPFVPPGSASATPPSPIPHFSEADLHPLIRANVSLQRAAPGIHPWTPTLHQEAEPLLRALDHDMRSLNQLLFGREVVPMQAQGIPSVPPRRGNTFETIQAHLRSSAAELLKVPAIRREADLTGWEDYYSIMLDFVPRLLLPLGYFPYMTSTSVMIPVNNVLMLPTAYVYKIATQESQVFRHTTPWHGPLSAPAFRMGDPATVGNQPMAASLDSYPSAGSAQFGALFLAPPFLAEKEVREFNAYLRRTREQFPALDGEAAFENFRLGFIRKSMPDSLPYEEQWLRAKNLGLIFLALHCSDDTVESYANRLMAHETEHIWDHMDPDFSRYLLPPIRHNPHLNTDTINNRILARTESNAMLADLLASEPTERALLDIIKYSIPPSFSPAHMQGADWVMRRLADEVQTHPGVYPEIRFDVPGIAPALQVVMQLWKIARDPRRVDALIADLHRINRAEYPNVLADLPRHELLEGKVDLPYYVKERGTDSGPPAVLASPSPEPEAESGGWFWTASRATVATLVLGIAGAKAWQIRLNRLEKFKLLDELEDWYLQILPTKKSGAAKAKAEALWEKLAGVGDNKQSAVDILKSVSGIFEKAVSLQEIGRWMRAASQLIRNEVLIQAVEEYCESPPDPRQTSPQA